MATIWSRMRAMFDAAGIHGAWRGHLWVEAFRTAVGCFNVTVKKGTQQCPSERWNGELPRWIKEIKLFGEWEWKRKWHLKDIIQ